MYERDFQEQLAAAMDQDQAVYSGDNDTMVLKAVVQTPAQVPVTEATYSPRTRPLPAGV